MDAGSTGIVTIMDITVGRTDSDPVSRWVTGTTLDHAVTDRITLDLRRTVLMATITTDQWVAMDHLAHRSFSADSKVVWIVTDVRSSRADVT